MKQSSELFTEGLKGKSQAISQKQVLAAYKQVKSKGGAGGVDGLNFQEFESRRNDHLYKLWNRLASGSYFPQAVQAHSKIRRDMAQTRHTDHFGQDSKWSKTSWSQDWRKSFIRAALATARTRADTKRWPKPNRIVGRTGGR